MVEVHAVFQVFVVKVSETEKIKMEKSRRKSFFQTDQHVKPVGKKMQITGSRFQKIRRYTLEFISRHEIEV